MSIGEIMRQVFLRFAIMLVGLSPMLFPVFQAQAGLPETIALVRPGVVAVGTMQATRRPPAKLLGTGFVIGDGTLVVTNAHVVPEILAVEKKEYLAVFAGRGKHSQRRRARLVAMDLKYDLAILKIEGDPLPMLQLGDSDQVSEGESIAFTGFPIGAVLGLYPVTHRGIVSAISPIVLPAQSGRQLTVKMIKRLRDPFDIFQLDATAYPGNSGSPLYLPKTGEVIGVLNMVLIKETKESVLEKPSGISYAIPIKHLKALLETVEDK